MPLLLPKVRGIRRESNATGRPTTTWGTALTSDGTAHVLPATYTQLIASTSFDTDWVNIWFHGNSASNTNTDSLVNIYVGADTAEQLLIPNLLAGWAPLLTGTGSWKAYGFPLRIPAGSRLSAKHQSVRTSTAVTCIVELLGGGELDHWFGTKVECVGAVTGSSRGTAVTPGTTNDGTLTSIGTNTNEFGFAQLMCGGDVTDTGLTGGVLTADIGNASTVLTGHDDYVFDLNSTEYIFNFSGGRYGVIPASTALYVRSQHSTSATDQNDFCIYGVY